MTLPTDEQLLVQYKQGDPRGFRQLVQRYTTPIYNLALRLLGDPMEAENVTQDTFLRVVTSVERVRLDLPFKPYLFRIAVNLCRDRGRKKRPLLFSEIDGSGSAEEEGTEADPPSEAVPEDTPPLWERLEKEEMNAQLYAALDTLPLTYQIVITLRYVEDLTYEEIAQTLNLPLNTVRTHLYRGKRELKSALERDNRAVRSHNGFAQFGAAEGGL